MLAFKNNANLSVRRQTYLIQDNSNISLTTSLHGASQYCVCDDDPIVLWDLAQPQRPIFEKKSPTSGGRHRESGSASTYRKLSDVFYLHRRMQLRFAQTVFTALVLAGSRCDEKTVLARKTRAQLLPTAGIARSSTTLGETSSTYIYRIELGSDKGTYIAFRMDRFCPSTKSKHLFRTCSSRACNAPCNVVIRSQSASLLAAAMLFQLLLHEMV